MPIKQGTLQTLSAVIITKNEAANLPECLATLSFCDEIVILDSGSSDQTKSIADSFRCRFFINTDWQGFGVQKQRALEQAQGDWVLSIDADERITPALREEILEAIQGQKFDGYMLPRKSYFLGSWLSHGGCFPDYILRLARRSKAQFSVSIVHETMHVNGQVGFLKTPMLHFSYRTIEDVLIKQRTYAVAGGVRKVLQGKRSGLLFALLASVWAFFRHYLIWRGFLDGRAGLIFSIARAQETFWKYLAAEDIAKTGSK